MLHWFYFVALTIIGYIGIAIFSQLVGSGAQSFFQALGNTIRPLPFIVVVTANVLLGGAIYFGFLVSSSAVPVMLVMGMLTTIVYSILFLGVTLTLTNIFGILLIVTGVYFLR